MMLELPELKKNFKVMIDRTESREELSLMCINMGESLKVRLTKLPRKEGGK